MLFAPFPRNAKTAHTPQSQASIMRRRCAIFLQEEILKRSGIHTPDVPRHPPLAQHNMLTRSLQIDCLTDIVRELVQEGSLSRAAGRIFSHLLP